MSCYWWMNLAFFLAGFWTVFAIGNYFGYRRQIKRMQQSLLYRSPRQWHLN